ncbi:MAG: RIP metalloprotease RseP [Lentimicrobiaceae bacterium]|jgi:regulator of sigma E protease
MVILIKVVQLLLSLSILVIFHEFGHFIAARIFKTRVEKFYLFFDPWFSLFKFKKGDTEYGIGWLPLGGYVKISGMIDESMDKEAMKLPPQPYEFRAKPSWQRLIIMLGGVTVNVILAIGIYVVMLAWWGEQYLPNSQVKYGITVDTLGQQLGLRNGDKILTLDNKPVEDFFRIPATIILEDVHTIQVERNNQPVDVVIPRELISQIVKHKSPEFISVRIPFEVADFAPGSPAKKAGMQVNDRIIGVNGQTTLYFDEFKAVVQKHENEKVNVIVLRGTDTVSLAIMVSDRGLIGVAPKSPAGYFTFKEYHYNILQAIPAGTVKAYEKTADYLKSLKLLFNPEVKAYESVGGFITIGSIFPSAWDWESFWSLTAFLSLMLAVLNILPIPALDGGHVMFLLYEIITGRKPSDKFMEYAQITGMVLLFALLIFANGNDIVKLFR